MDEDMLRDYNNWVGRSPQEIIDHVKKLGGWLTGWKAVFPGKIPLWAHRVRNFFNQEPKSLLRFDPDATHEFMANIDRSLAALSNGSHWGDWGRVAELKALSGHVYMDASRKVWYQMSGGGTIYHWGSNPRVAPLESAYQLLKGQAGVPIFKLVSPDGTGGSHETILRNAGHSSRMAKRENHLIYVAHLVNTDYFHQGSYNYSETVDAGYSNHKKHDVEPHEKYPYEEVYINPPDRFAPIASRRFPKTDERGNPLAKMT